MNCSSLGIGNSNRKKRKFTECNNETVEDKDCVPVPKLINVCIICMVLALIIIIFSNKVIGTYLIFIIILLFNFFFILSSVFLITNFTGNYF